MTPKGLNACEEASSWHDDKHQGMSKGQEPSSRYVQGADRLFPRLRRGSQWRQCLSSLVGTQARTRRDGVLLQIQTIPFANCEASSAHELPER